MLGFSNFGSRGWVRTRTELHHLLAVRNRAGGWLGARTVFVTEASLNDDGYMMEGECKAERPKVPPVPISHQDLPEFPDFGNLRTVDTISFHECTIAMETDYQYYELFGDLNAATSYLTTLLSYISDRYELQTNTVLTFPYLQLYTNSNDPWSTPDNGGGSIDMLNEFVNAWQGNVPTGAILGHLMSGASLGGGVAYLNGICSNSSNFGVSGNIGYQGFVNFPVVQQPANWDFIVVAHEIGHNFGSPHTHDFCPPLDECPASQYWGSCQTQQVCSSSGSIMSYCHLCPGGTGNITTYFHPEAAALMTSVAQSCTPSIWEVTINAPDVVSDSSGTPTTLQTVSGNVNSATVYYRLAGQSAFTSMALSAQGGGLFQVDLPATPCGESLEYYFDFDVAGTGTFSAPNGAPTAL
ncbi:MAG: zinc-dependent metalloprotease, partial [Actinomycetota bacterium]